MTSSGIPIRNLYFLLCYAWNRLTQGEVIDVSKIPTTELADLFALVLCDGIQHLARRGIEQGYELRTEDLRGIRGRIDILASARRLLFVHGRATCNFDELSANTLSNRILKSTLRALSQCSTLDPSLGKRVNSLYRQLHDISDVTITAQVFRRVQLHSNNRFYRFLLNVCELVHDSLLVDQTSGEHRFRDFIRDEKVMHRVFQDFLYNFIRIENPSWDVRRRHIPWRAESETDPTLSLLPRLETDISLIRPGKEKVIIDAKYYQKTLTDRYDTEKIHGEHLYQLLTYLNQSESHASGIAGMLIYPRTSRTLRETYRIGAFQISICTIDLNQDWLDLKKEILALVA